MSMHLLGPQKSNHQERRLANMDCAQPVCSYPFACGSSNELCQTHANAVQPLHVTEGISGRHIRAYAQGSSCKRACGSAVHVESLQRRLG